MTRSPFVLNPLIAVGLVGLGLGLGCGPNNDGHGPVAEGISAPMGEPLPSATAEQLATFERGREVALRRFDIGDGLGPAFNVTFCGSCHEKPVIGGSAGSYRNFFLGGIQLEDGPFVLGHAVSLFECGDVETAPEDRVTNPPPESNTGVFTGVVRQYYYGADNTARPAPDVDLNVITQRNPIPFFGVGLLAELPEDSILANADPDDDNNDGISGRPNFDEGFVGRFGRKAQTVSIEGFIRGPLFNHLGITTDPLSNEQRSRLPVDSSLSEGEQASMWIGNHLRKHAQAAAPSGPNCDLDDAQDPEMSTDDLFDLVSFSMLLAAPEFEPMNEQRKSGQKLFDKAGCDRCHVPRLEGPRGPIPAYTDLLLHDMGPELSDGLVMGEASASEFRTQPLWGISAVGPYLHDGSAVTLDEAIRRHGGEGARARDAYIGFTDSERGDLIEFMLSLGGRSQSTSGLLLPNQPVPDVGEYGGPVRALSELEEQDFIAARELFDREFGLSEGLGAPRLNGDSCRACHFDPVIGGAGPRGVNVMRHGIINGNGEFVVPTVGTILHKTTSLESNANLPQSDATVFEHRQTPALFGVGLIDDIADADIIANADPDDLDGDGISGRVSRVDGGKLGRFGWKAQVPSLAEFARDGISAELGLTLPLVEGKNFGRINDNDDIPDPEVTAEVADGLELFMRLLAPPPRQTAADPVAAAAGEQLFDTVGCTRCHTPELPGADGPVALYSDLLLHEILPPGAVGIEDASANMREFRTAPLWGISKTAPYLHSGAADTLDEAIRGHDGEAAGVRDAFIALSATERDQLIQFLETL